ncbi:MAG: S1C family serine protease [Candidatus Nanopelagicales bacterium]
MSDDRPNDTPEPGTGSLAVHDDSAYVADAHDTVVVPSHPEDAQDTAVFATASTSAFAAPDASTRVDGPPVPGAVPGFEPPLLGASETWDAPPAAPAKQRTGGTGRVVAIAVASGLLAGAVGGVGAYTVAENRSSGSLTSAGATIPQTDADLSARPEGSIAAVAAAVLPTVVQIEEQSGSGGGTGSGFILRSDGYILTNNHVVEGAAGGGSLTVRFQDGSTVPAKIVGRDTSYDLAVIKVERTGLPVATLGNSDGIVVGDSTIAVGSPLGLEGTVTAGIVSALNRPVTAGGSGSNSFINAIQTDAAINPGNSGGPLLDAEGKVIGVNSAIASLGASNGGQSGSIGLGFAIPINQAKRVAEEIISTGVSSHPIIGVSVDSRYTGVGAKVQDVTAGGPAEAAGIKAGDVIVDVNGRAVSDSTELIVAIRTYTPGEKITLGIQDGSSVRTVEVTLGSDSSTG